MKTLVKKEFRTSAFSTSVSAVVPSGCFTYSYSSPHLRSSIPVEYLRVCFGLRSNNFFKVSNSFSHLSFYLVCGMPINKINSSGFLYISPLI